MRGEINSFRKRAFGGFNQDDVINYVAKASQERNALIDANNKAEAELKKLAEELASVRAELEEALGRNNKEKVVAFNEAEVVFNEMRTSFDKAHAEIIGAYDRANEELSAAPIDELPGIIEDAHNKLNNLRAVVMPEVAESGEAVNHDFNGDRGTVIKISGKMRKS